MNDRLMDVWVRFAFILNGVIAELCSTYEICFEALRKADEFIILIDQTFVARNLGLQGLN